MTWASRHCTECTIRLDRDPCSLWEQVHKQELCWECFADMRLTTHKESGRRCCPRCGLVEGGPGAGALGHSPYCIAEQHREKERKRR